MVDRTKETGKMASSMELEFLQIKMEIREQLSEKMVKRPNGLINSVVFLRLF
jgi:hypothetical protein